jgi:hypothetical protein
MSLAIQAALPNVDQERQPETDLGHSFKISGYRGQFQSEIANKDPLSQMGELAREIQPIVFASIKSGAESLAQQQQQFGRDQSYFLKLGSQLAEMIMSNQDIGGEARRSLGRAQREATLLAGTDPKDALLSLSRYNFLAYHLNEAVERALPIAA